MVTITPTCTKVYTKFQQKYFINFILVTLPFDKQ